MSRRVLTGILAVVLDTTMTHESLLDRIVADPAICHGRPCIRGHRIWVSFIVDLLAEGLTAEQILQQYPGLQPDDIRACIAYAAEMTRERIVVARSKPSQ